MTVKIIAEIGINHHGKVRIAEQLIRTASEAGAWGIKFQYRNPDTFYVRTDEIGDEILEQEISRASIDPCHYQALIEYAHELGLKVGISFFRVEDIVAYGEGVWKYDYYKVPSAELMNRCLYDELSRFGRMVVLSTGGHDQQSIFRRLDELAGEEVAFLHCVANYPLLLGRQNLSFIQRMARQTKLEVGYSSHDEDWEACIIAVLMGASIIERHITLDKYAGGLDDSTSSDPDEFKRLCRIINSINEIKGDGERVINQGEVINMQNLGTSLYSLENINSGRSVGLSDFSVQAPRKGMTSDEFVALDHRKLCKSIRAGEPVTYAHFKKKDDQLSEQCIQYCNEKQISVPIRLHDAAVITTKIPIDNYEFHLSYGDVEKNGNNIKRLLTLCDNNCSYSIHLPDYLHGNRLIDPLSNDTDTRKDSVRMVHQVSQIAERLAELTGRRIVVVASFSRLHDDHRSTLDGVYNFIAEYETSSCIILPQWLPKIAWYFGGAQKLAMFCQQRDIDYIVDHEARICLDVAHLILSANYAGSNWFDWYKILANHADHLHVSDATGIEGEGVKFGSGDLYNLERILDHPKKKVLEVWQGHLDSGHGFVEAIKFLGAMNEKSINKRNNRTRRRISVETTS